MLLCFWIDIVECFTKNGDQEVQEDNHEKERVEQPGGPDNERHDVLHIRILVLGIPELVHWNSIITNWVSVGLNNIHSQLIQSSVITRGNSHTLNSEQNGKEKHPENQETCEWNTSCDTITYTVNQKTKAFTDSQVEHDLDESLGDDDVVQDRKQEYSTDFVFINLGVGFDWNNWTCLIEDSLGEVEAVCQKHS